MEKVTMYKSKDGKLHVTENSARETDSRNEIMTMLTQMLNTIQSDVGAYELINMFIINPLGTAELSRMVLDHVNTFGQ